MRKNFKVNYLKEELGLPWNSDNLIEDKVVDIGRWTAFHEIIFVDNGKCWKAEYTCGATELQDEEPWDYQDEVECEEMELKEVVVKKWVSVKED